MNNILTAKLGTPEEVMHQLGAMVFDSNDEPRKTWKENYQAWKTETAAEESLRYAHRNCMYCVGRLVYYAPDGPDGVNAEVCPMI